VTSASPAQLKVVVATADFDGARSVAGWLGEVLEPPPLAVTQFEAGSSGHVVEAYFDHRPDLDAIARALNELGQARLSPPRLETVPDDNWVALSQAALPPVRAGRFIVHGSHDAEWIGRRSGAILIDAGEAFGTAHHATTQGCLEAIDDLTRVKRFTRVLDLGCGSGVLAIAAARALPAAAVVASDVDPIATAVAAANARANGTRQIRVVTAVGFAHAWLRPPHRFDLVIANILATPLIVLAPAMRRAMARGGRVVLSGLLTAQAAQVIAAYRAQGFYLEARRDIAGWSALTLGARSA
jgi:ribosomal protein L11 methyltransferase